MAAELATPTVNGNYAAQPPYGGGDAHAGTITANGPSAPSASGNSESSLTKDEVGWYFVEQYYTTLSRNPERLHVCRWLTPLAPT